MPKRIEGLQGVRAVAISSAVSHSLVLAADGAVYSFGSGGPLGHGDDQHLADGDVRCELSLVARGRQQLHGLRFLLLG